MGIDYGTKRIGLALSDMEGKIAFPHKVVLAEEAAILIISKICNEEGVEEVVIGESRDFKGEPNPVMKKIEIFKTALEKVTSLPVQLEPEYMTSSQAERIDNERREENRKSGLRVRRPKVKNKMLDASAAAVILQSYIDKKHQ
ncbi:MAG: hypothetical protein A3A22_00405 [Candidatus Taylorbacteria bacterium RIFCSPLOWO2_01_FULL_45_34b]|nr:MAG: hypothetical protein A3A22_00405 [Candidatus Taylorbacteria bacterium RIFCSPLOWO2_01_FULL_45_34b]